MLGSCTVILVYYYQLAYYPRISIGTAQTPLLHKSTSFQLFLLPYIPVKSMTNLV